VLISVHGSDMFDVIGSVRRSVVAELTSVLLFSGVDVEMVFVFALADKPLGRFARVTHVWFVGFFRVVALLVFPHFPRRHHFAAKIAGQFRVGFPHVSLVKTFRNTIVIANLTDELARSQPVHTFHVNLHFARQNFFAAMSHTAFFKMALMPWCRDLM